MRVMVTGAAGQLGSAIVRTFADHPLLALGRDRLDISSAPAVQEAVEGFRPDVLINCAAYNDVDGAEDDAPAALQANAFGVLALARAAAANGVTLVHYSTDFVFDGEHDRPYSEADRPRPLSTYGASKLIGEWFATEAPTTYVLRVESLFGGRPAKSSVDKILHAIRAGLPVRLFADRTVTPSYVDDVAAATEALLARHPSPGLYHCVNDGVTTWAGIAEELQRLLQCSAELVPVQMHEVRLKARRPLYCALSNDKLRRAGIVLPSWQDALARYVSAADPSRVDRGGDSGRSGR